MRFDNFSFETTTPDGLQGVRWGFFLLNNRLVVDEYVSWTRQTKRHKAQIQHSWFRLSGRGATLTLKKADVPFTPEIAAKAKQEWLKLLEANVTVGFSD